MNSSIELVDESSSDVQVPKYIPEYQNIGTGLIIKSIKSLSVQDLDIIICECTELKNKILKEENNEFLEN